jgi:MoaA/NifB/PqqE/SkfB family radical SAM enzyme
MRVRNVFDRLWWEDQVRYTPLAQRLYLGLSLSNQFPATVNIEPTNCCNLNCTFCPTDKTNRGKGYMEMEIFRGLTQELKKHPLAVLWLNKDGEPLLHPKIGEMIKLAKADKVARRIEIYSNGWLLDKVKSRELIESGLDSLVISVDAVNAQDYQTLKGKNGYEKVVGNIEAFLEVRKSLGKSSPKLAVKWVGSDRGKTEEFKRTWQGKADRVVIQELHNWEGSVEISNFKFLRLSKPRVHDWKSGQISNLIRYPCNLPWLSPAINWDGSVVPCCINYRENELVMGNIINSSLTKIYRGNNFKELRKAHLDQNFTNYPTCKHCRFWQQLPNMGFRLRRIGV